MSPLIRWLKVESGFNLILVPKKPLTAKFEQYVPEILFVELQEIKQNAISPKMKNIGFVTLAFCLHAEGKEFIKVSLKLNAVQTARLQRTGLCAGGKLEFPSARTVSRM